MAVNGDARLYQSRQQARWIAALLLVALGIAIWVVVAIVAGHPRHGRPDRRLVGIVVVGVLAVVGFTVGIRAVRSGVVVTGQLVTVRNPFRSIRLSWDEIDHFSVEPNGIWSIGCATLKDGKVVRIWGIQGQIRGLFRNSEWATRPIDELNKALRAQTA